MTDKTMTEVRDWHLDAYKVTGQPKHKDMADAITRHLSQTAERGEAVGMAGTMPGTDGFTMACFKASDVPVGTELYTAPPPAAGVPDARIIDLAERLVAAGPKAAHVSASECHEISEFIRSLSATPSPAIDVAAVPYRMCACHTLDQRKLCADRHQCSMPETQSAIGDAK